MGIARISRLQSQGRAVNNSPPGDPVDLTEDEREFLESNPRDSLDGTRSPDISLLIAKPLTPITRPGGPGDAELSDRTTSGSEMSDSSVSLNTAMNMETPHDREIRSILALSDSVRASLTENLSLGSDTTRLTQFLNSVLADEVHDGRSLSFDTLLKAHLDKLLQDLLDPLKKPDPVPGTIFAVMTAAKSLEKSWRARFKERYADIDKRRLSAMLSNGALRDVTFASLSADNIVTWKAKQVTPACEVEDSCKFRPGQWWLNISCAHRDGVVDNDEEKPTKGRYGIAALPLLTGEEESLEDRKIKYVRRSLHRAQMHIPLMSKVGCRMRILRGYQLRSLFAPIGGVRYDGLYILRQYGLKLDEFTELYRLELTMERIESQKPLALLQRIPKPAQLDQWTLYQKFEKDKITQIYGEARSTQWYLTNQEEEAARSRWHADHNPGEEFGVDVSGDKFEPKRRRSLVRLSLPEDKWHAARIKDPTDEPTPER